MRTRTKIICTLGPATNSYDKMTQLIDAGMSVARINMSHGSHKEHAKTIQLLKKVRKEKKTALAIMLDTKGPEVRLGVLKHSLSLEKGSRLVIKKVPEKEEITLEPFEVIQDLKEGGEILFDDGYIKTKIIEKRENALVVEVENPGILRSQKGVNLPSADLKLPAVTERDLADIAFGCQCGIDLLAASFIRSADHIHTIKDILKQYHSSHVLVIAKIESAMGVKNFDSILQAADGIMVARGDLGVELPVTQVPRLQKIMIRKCDQFFKPVVIATQMLESMILNPRPTRAEVSDVANAIYDSTSAVMLSGETAIGKYPIETVKLMRQTIAEAEEDFGYESFCKKASNYLPYDISSSVALAAVETAYNARAKALIALTTSGFTARLMGKFRPKMPIVAVTSEEKIYHQLAFLWGTVPVHEKVDNVRQGVEKASAYVLAQKLVRYGDPIIVTSGTPFGVSGTTNVMLVDTIGDVLVRGRPGKGRRVYGKVFFLLSFDPQKTYSFKGKCVVMSYCSEDFKPDLKGAKALILQNHPDDFHSEEVAKRLGALFKIPVLLRADAACSVLKKGALITLDPEKGLIFEGKIEPHHDQDR